MSSEITFRCIPRHLKAIIYSYRAVQRKSSQYPSKETMSFMNSRSVDLIKSLKAQILSPRPHVRQGAANINLGASKYRLHSNFSRQLLSENLNLSHLDELHTVELFKPKSEVKSIGLPDLTNSDNFAKKMEGHHAKMEISIASYFIKPFSPQIKLNQTHEELSQNTNKYISSQQLKWFRETLQLAPIMIILAQTHRVFSSDSINQINPTWTTFRNEVAQLKSTFGKKYRESTSAEAFIPRSYHLTEMNAINKFVSLFPEGDEFRAAILAHNKVQVLDCRLKPVLIAKSSEEEELIEEVEVNTNELKESTKNIIESGKTCTNIQHIVEECNQFVAKTQKQVIPENSYNPPYDATFTTFSMLTMESAVASFSQREILRLLDKYSGELQIVGLRLCKSQPWVYQNVESFQEQANHGTENAVEKSKMRDSFEEIMRFAGEHGFLRVEMAEDAMYLLKKDEKIETE